MYTLMNKILIRKQTGLMLALLSAIAVMQSSAQNTNVPNKVGPMGIEVNTRTGNTFLHRTDLYIPARQLDLDISFSYNSYAFDRNKGYGNGWMFEYSMFYIPDSSGNVIITESGGREDKYTKNGSVFIPPTGHFDTLSEYQAGKYLLRTTGGIRFYFDNSTHKRLTKITEPNGNLLNFGYTDSLVTSISNAAGQTITLNYTTGKLSSVTDANAQPVQTYSYSYDSYGNLTKVTDPMGGTTKYSYLVNGPMASMTDKNNNVTDIIYFSNYAARELISCNSRTAFSYDSASRTTVVIDFVPAAGNQTSTYVYNEKGWLSHLIGSCCGYDMTFTYDNSGNLLQRKDAKGNVYNYTYDNRGNYLTITDPLNNVTTYTYSTDFNNVTSIIDPLGNTYTASYDPAGNITHANRPANQQILMSYNANGDLLTFTDANNNMTTTQFDAYGYPQKITMPLNVEVSSVFDARGNVISGKNANGNNYSYQYDSLNRITKVIDPLGFLHLITYDKKGNLKTYTDPKGFTQTILYDASDRMVTFKDSKGMDQIYTYDEMHNLTSYTDALGKKTVMAYDKQNRIIALTNAAGNGFSFAYDPNGNMVSAEGPNGNHVSYTYDALNRIISGRDDTGQLGTIGYDKNGNTISISNGDGVSILNTYDNLNRLTRVTDPLGNSRVFTYDNNSNLLSNTDRNNHTSSFTYNALNRVTSFTDNNGNHINATYDSAGNLTQITDQNGNNTQYIYDSLNRLTRTTYPGGTFVQLEYDKNNNIVAKKQTDGNSITLTYDSLNHVIAKDLPDGEHFTYTWDAKSRLLSATNAAGTINFTYDDVDRLISETFNGHSTTYIYDVPGRKLTITYPYGTQVTRSYDKRNRLTDLSVNNKSIATYQYNNINQLIQKNYSNSVNTFYQYDAATRLSSITTNKSNIPAMSFQYDNEMNLKVVARTNMPQASETFVYDAGYRLINYKQGTLAGNTIPSPLILNTYSYDGVGNRTAASLNGLSTTYTLNTLNQLIHLTNTSQNINFSYDGNGNQTYDGNFYSRYDPEGKKLVDSSAGGIYRFQYDAVGRRIQKTSNGIPVKFYYAGLLLTEERNAADSLLAEQIYANAFMPVTRNSGNQKYFYHQNHLNSTEAITDSLGRVKEWYKYEDFGKSSLYDSLYNPLVSSTVNNTILFTGQQYDAHNSSYQFHFRNYSPDNGSFSQRDPIGYADQMGMYQYVGNNPASYNDPLGLTPCPQEGWEKGKEAIGMFDNSLDLVSFLLENHLEPLLKEQARFKLDLHNWRELQKVGFEYARAGFKNDALAIFEKINDLRPTNAIKKGALRYMEKTLTPLKNAGEYIEGLGKGFNLIDVGIKGGDLYDAYNKHGVNSNYTAEAAGKFGQSLLNFIPEAEAVDLGNTGTGMWLSLLSRKLGKGEIESGSLTDLVIKGNADASLAKDDLNSFESELEMQSLYDHRGIWRLSQYYKARERALMGDPTRQHLGNEDCPPNNNTNGIQKDNLFNRLFKFFTEIFVVHDPNAIIGPDGVGNNKWVSVNDRMPYNVLFENDTTATAPVKVLKVICPIDPKQDASTFQLGDFGFNNLTFSVPQNANNYSQRLDLRDSLGIFVDVTAGLDGVNNQAFWIFESIDPVTYLPITDPLKGLLLTQNPSKPANGHGFVNFSIKPLSSDHTGDTTSAYANIVFDANDTVPTNRAKNTIDALPPTTHLTNFTQTANPSVVQLHWHGNDDPGGSGIATYSLYLSINGRPYALYRSGISDSAFLFTGVRDTVYCFFVGGIDSVNNKEPLKNGCELLVTVNGVTLPLTWLDFTGIRRGDDALLNWSTGSETNTKVFIVERSLDGTRFNPIGNVNAAGNSNSIRNYTFTDPGIIQLGVNIIYYRIQELDLDGRQNYSRIIAIRIDNGNNEPLVSTFPNPFTKYITVKVTPANTQDKTNSVELYSMQGVLLYRKEIGKPGVSITVLNDLPELPGGMYLLKTTVNGIPYTSKMIKN